MPHRLGRSSSIRPADAVFPFSFPASPALGAVDELEERSDLTTIKGDRFIDPHLLTP